MAEILIDNKVMIEQINTFGIDEEEEDEFLLYLREDKKKIDLKNCDHWVARMNSDQRNKYFKELTGMSKDAFSKKFGINTGYINKFMQDGYSSSISLIEACKKLGIPVRNARENSHFYRWLKHNGFALNRLDEFVTTYAEEYIDPLLSINEIQQGESQSPERSFTKKEVKSLVGPKPTPILQVFNGEVIPPWVSATDNLELYELLFRLMVEEDKFITAQQFDEEITYFGTNPDPDTDDAKRRNKH